MNRHNQPQLSEFLDVFVADSFLIQIFLFFQSFEGNPYKSLYTDKSYSNY
jgi:hypothetical protein